MHGGVVREPSNLACGYEWRWLWWWPPCFLFLCFLLLLPSSGRSDDSVAGCKLCGPAWQHDEKAGCWQMAPGSEDTHTAAERSLHLTVKRARLQMTGSRSTYRCTLM